MERDALVAIDLTARLRHPSLRLQERGEKITGLLTEEVALQILDCVSFLAEEGVFLPDISREDLVVVPVRENYRFAIGRASNAVYHPEQEIEELSFERLARLLLKEGEYSEDLTVSLENLAAGREKTVVEILANLDYAPTRGISLQRPEIKREPNLELLRGIYRQCRDLPLKAETFFLAYDMALRGKRSSFSAAGYVSLAAALCGDLAWRGERELEEEVKIVKDLKGGLYYENYFTLSPTAHHLELAARALGEDLRSGRVQTDILAVSYRNSEAEFDDLDVRRKDVVFFQISQPI